METERVDRGTLYSEKILSKRSAEKLLRTVESHRLTALH